MIVKQYDTLGRVSTELRFYVYTRIQPEQVMEALRYLRGSHEKRVINTVIK